jgi:hypothetical protein
MTGGMHRNPSIGCRGSRGVRTPGTCVLPPHPLRRVSPSPPWTSTVISLARPAHPGQNRRSSRSARGCCRRVRVHLAHQTYRGSSHGSDRPIRPNSECADAPGGARLPCSQIPPLRPRRRDAARSPLSNCLSSDQPVAMSERHSEAGIRRRSRSPDQNSIEGVERLLASAVADQADPAFWSITGLRPVLRGCWPRHGHVGVVLCAVACAS